MALRDIAVELATNIGLATSDRRCVDGAYLSPNYKIEGSSWSRSSSRTAGLIPGPHRARRGQGLQRQAICCASPAPDEVARVRCELVRVSEGGQANDQPVPFPIGAPRLCPTLLRQGQRGRLISGLYNPQHSEFDAAWSSAALVDNPPAHPSCPMVKLTLRPAP